MFNIDSGGAVTITQGEKGTIKLKLYDVNKMAYTPETGSSIVITVKEDTASTSPTLLTKTFDSNMEASIASTDTASMDPGRYQYDVTIVYSDGQTVNVQGPSAFIVQDRVRKVTVSGGT